MIAKQGVYFVRYVPMTAEGGEPGFFSRLFNSSSKNTDAVKFQIALRNQERQTTVVVNDAKGGPVSTDNAQRILKLMPTISADLRFRTTKKPPEGGFFVVPLQQLLEAAAAGAEASAAGRSSSGRSRCVRCGEQAGAGAGAGKQQREPVRSRSFFFYPRREQQQRSRLPK